jgi:hypothetical protein
VDLGSRPHGQIPSSSFDSREKDLCFCFLRQSVLTNTICQNKWYTGVYTLNVVYSLVAYLMLLKLYSTLYLLSFGAGDKAGVISDNTQREGTKIFLLTLEQFQGYFTLCEAR